MEDPGGGLPEVLHRRDLRLERADRLKSLPREPLRPRRLHNHDLALQRRARCGHFDPSGDAGNVLCRGEHQPRAVVEADHRRGGVDRHHSPGHLPAALSGRAGGAEQAPHPAEAGERILGVGSLQCQEPVPEGERVRVTIGCRVSQVEPRRPHDHRELTLICRRGDALHPPSRQPEPRAGSLRRATRGDSELGPRGAQPGEAGTQEPAGTAGGPDVAHGVRGIVDQSGRGDDEVHKGAAGHTGPEPSRRGRAHVTPVGDAVAVVVAARQWRRERVGGRGRPGRPGPRRARLGKPARRGRHREGPAGARGVGSRGRKRKHGGASRCDGEAPPREARRGGGARRSWPVGSRDGDPVGRPEDHARQGLIPGAAHLQRVAHARAGDGAFGRHRGRGRVRHDAKQQQRQRHRYRGHLHTHCRLTYSAPRRSCGSARLVQDDPGILSSG